MFSSLKGVFEQISDRKLKQDETKDAWWIKLILELFSKIHQIDHNINKIFTWLLSECKSLHEQNVDDSNTHAIETYLNALFATIQIATERKLQLEGLEILLKDICLSVIVNNESTNSRLNTIAMQIIEYLCHHTHHVWNVCGEFALFQFKLHCNESHGPDTLHLLNFGRLCQFVLMLLKCHSSQATNKIVVEWISNIHCLCCKLIHKHNYLQVLCKTLFFKLYSDHDSYAFITHDLLYGFSKNILMSIDTLKSKLSIEHFLLIQWFAPILFDDEFRKEPYCIAQQYRTCVLYGLQNEIKAMEQISIYLLQKHAEFILYPVALPKECVASLCTAYNIMYEVRASTISNLLSVHIMKLLPLLSMNSNNTENAMNVISWIYSVLHIIWKKGLKHRNKAVRRITMYALLSWDFDASNAPFAQSFVLNEFLILLNHPLWFRKSYYDITKNQTNDNYGARPKSNWKTVSSKSEEALSSKSPPEGFGFLIELFLSHYLFKCNHEPFAKQVFLSEFIQSVCTKVTSFYSLYYIFGFLSAIHKHEEYNTHLWIVNKRNITSLQTMLHNAPKFGPLYNKKLVPLICEVISMHIDPKIEFYSVCKLMDAIPKCHVSPSESNLGFIHLQKNLNRDDWIGKQLLILIKQYMMQLNDETTIKVDIIQNILQYVDCGESLNAIMDVLFNVASVSYSHPYKSETIVQFCMQLLSFVIDLAQRYPNFTKYRDILRQRMTEAIHEIVSYIFEQQWSSIDFSNHKQWKLKLAQNLLQYYGDLSAVKAWITVTLNKIVPNCYFHSQQDVYAVQDFPPLYLMSICIKYQYDLTIQIINNIEKGNDVNVHDHILSLWISIRLNPNVNKTHIDTLQFIQFNAILGALSQTDVVISKETARNVIQFAVHTLDHTQTQIRSAILESISLLLPFAQLSSSNLNVLSTSVWYVLSDTNAKTSIPDSYCIDLLLFPTLFDDKQLHSSPDGPIRKQLQRAFESKKSSILQPMLSYAFLLWCKYPAIASLYVDQIVSMTHTVYNTKIFDPEDRIYREEYLFAALLMFLSAIFQKNTKAHFTFKSLFVTKLFAMIDKECELPYLDVIHQKTWNIFWHISQFISQSYGFEDAEIRQILNFLCDLCYNMNRTISSNQRQWITLSIIRIIVQTPKYIHCLFKKYAIIGRKPNTHIWLMYALGDCANKLVAKYKSDPDCISKDFLMDSLQHIICILTPYLTNNYGLVRTTTQYFFHALVKQCISMNTEHHLGAVIMSLYEDLDKTPDSIKLRTRLKSCYQWLEQTVILHDNEDKEEEKEKEVQAHNVLEQQLKISQHKAYEESEMLQERIIKNLVIQHDNNHNEVVVDEIVRLVKNRVGLVSFTDQLADALSNVLLSTFKYYGGNASNNDKQLQCDSKQLMGYQRKLDPLRVEYNKCVETEQLRLQQEVKANRRKAFGDVIVVASLLEKATNLGGISRTCEIFGVNKMIVNDKRMMKRDDFKRLSVTSEQWLPIEQVARKDLIAYLRKQKESNKYAIIGLEQTTSSKKLNEFKFIDANGKCIIVIGTEKTGLPPDIINECDCCVEIPQFGVVRSLNAHVSFAITLWEYVKQQLKSK